MNENDDIPQTVSPDAVQGLLGSDDWISNEGHDYLCATFHSDFLSDGGCPG